MEYDKDKLQDYKNYMKTMLEILKKTKTIKVCVEFMTRNNQTIDENKIHL